MSPAAIARAPNHPAANSLTALESNYLAAQNEASDDIWGNTIMDNSLDFDLLAEYLLEDGGGIFDLG
jgi:hypothetical protein